MSNNNFYAWTGQGLLLTIILIFSSVLFFYGCSDKISGSTSSPDPDIHAEADLVKGATANAVSANKFKVFDGTWYRPTPWPLNNYGLNDIKMAYTPSIFSKGVGRLEGTTHMPDKNKVKKLARRAARRGTKYICVDIEHWHLSGKYSDRTVRKSVDRFIKIANWIREAAPGMKVGFYKMPPLRNYFASRKPKSSKRYKKWKKNNKRIQRLIDNVDVFFPSMYTFNNNRKHWVEEAKRQIELARELGDNKPVYLVLWPKYHPYYKKYNNRYIEEGYWNLQLQTARKYADGLLVYTRRSNENWNNSARWWIRLKHMMLDMDRVGWADKWSSN